MYRCAAASIGETRTNEPWLSKVEIGFGPPRVSAALVQTWWFDCASNSSIADYTVPDICLVALDIRLYRSHS